MAAIHDVRANVHVPIYVHVLLDCRKCAVRVANAIITITLILLHTGVCVRVDVMHALEICIINTRGAICGVIIKVVRLEEILRGWGQRDAKDVYRYEIWKSVQCT
jgi:hypothetical protein